MVDTINFLLHCIIAGIPLALAIMIHIELWLNFHRRKEQMPFTTKLLIGSVYLWGILCSAYVITWAWFG